ncbi:MAG: replicative DNA helicase [Spirochaetes bacterium GWF1_51_8]|nr:MAG: replicative DNA helicase [Spirochaetes bacterium GWF1_51_8]
MSSDDLLKRVPPHNLEAESACLGAMMMNSYAVDTVLQLLTDEDFFDIKNQIIFRAVASLRDKSIPVDIVSVSDYLNSTAELERIGGSAYLSRLVEQVPSATNVSYYAKIVLDKSVLRNLINTCSNIVDNVYEYQTEMDRVLDEAESSVFEASSRKVKSDFLILKKSLVEAIDVIENRKNQGEYTGIPTGFYLFDEMTSGFQKSDLVVIAARPSMGKTAFALNIALNIGKKNPDYGILFFSLEMSAQELTLRSLSSESGIPLKKIRSGRITKEDHQDLLTAAKKLEKTKILIDDTPAIPLNELRSKARRAFRKYDVKIIFIDHLQIITAGDPNKPSFNRVQEMSYITRSLKALAKELQIPVVALSQLSRASEKREDKAPMLSDLRDSGTIEQDADVISFLHRDEYYTGKKSEEELQKEKNQAELLILKHRNGPIGKVMLGFYGEIVKFMNLEQHRGDQERVADEMSRNF